MNPDKYRKNRSVDFGGTCGYKTFIYTLEFTYWFNCYGELNNLFVAKKQSFTSILIFQGCEIIDNRLFEDGLKYIGIDEI